MRRWRGVVLLCCVSAGCPAPAPAGPRPPNIVLFLMDDAGREVFGCYGGESYRTPRIDRLAAEGMRFTHCFSQPLCTPSRVKLLTGLSNGRNYVRFSILPRGEVTVAERLRRAGYATMVAGKWQLLGASQYGSVAGTGSTPEDAGFDEYCLWQLRVLGSRYTSPVMETNGREPELHEGGYGPDIACDATLDFITRHRDRPFFVLQSMILLHEPAEPTPESRPGTTREEWVPDMVAHADGIVGRVVDHLKALGLEEDTLVLFTSDNGTNTKVTSRCEGVDVPGGKGRTTDLGTRMPLVAYLPGTVAAGSVCEELVDFSDFLPTLLDAAGVPRADVPTDGVSFWPALTGAPWTPREWVYSYYNPRPDHNPGKGKQSVRGRRYKLYDNGRLFDVEADPAERHPLRPGEDDAARAALRAEYARVLATMPAGEAVAPYEGPPGGAAEDDPGGAADGAQGGGSDSR